MSEKRQHPKWWQLYLGLPVSLGLFYRETLAPFSETEHIMAELGILLLIFGAVRAWLRANRSALMESEAIEAGWGVAVYETPPLYGLDDQDDNREELTERKAPASDAKVVPADSLARVLRKGEVGVFANRSAVMRKD